MHLLKCTLCKGRSRGVEWEIWTDHSKLWCLHDASIAMNIKQPYVHTHTSMGVDSVLFISFFFLMTRYPEVTPYCFLVWKAAEPQRRRFTGSRECSAPKHGCLMLC